MGRNPRVYITLDPEDYDSLTRIARHKDTQLATVIGQMIRDARPILSQLADTLDQAQGLALKLPASAAVKMGDLEQQAQELEHGAQELLDQVHEEAADQREKRGEKRRRPSASGKPL
jgi:hypothetical protein